MVVASWTTGGSCSVFETLFIGCSFVLKKECQTYGFRFLLNMMKVKCKYSIIRFLLNLYFLGVYAYDVIL